MPLPVEKTFGVPWDRLERALKRIKELQGPKPKGSQIWPTIFLCGLELYQSYGSIHGRPPVHPEHDGLLERVEEALPVFVKAMSIHGPAKVERAILRTKCPEFHFFQTAFFSFEDMLADSVKDWISQGAAEQKFTQLVFGMGVIALVNPCSREPILTVLRKPFPFHHDLQDVVNGFKWNAEWAGN